MINIGEIYSEQGDYPKAIEYSSKALKLFEELGDKQGIAHSLINVGSVYIKDGHHEKALPYGSKSLSIAEEIGSLDAIHKAHELLSDTYEKLGRSSKALLHYREYIVARDSIYNEENTKKLVQSEMQYEFEKEQQKQQLEQEKKDAVTQAELKKQRVIIGSVSAGLVLLIVFAAFVYNRFRVIRKQKRVIEKQNRKITDSITYAKRIQHAILPSVQEIQEAFPNSFIFYKPRDIVSGDFYWYTPLGDNGEESYMLAAADCTGHGVPGAFMSMIGNTLLNEIVNEKGIHQPGEVLTQLREGAINALAQSGETEQKDGMDIALCRIDKKNKQLEYAGAYNPLYLIRKGEVQEVKADKFPVGVHVLKAENHPFTNHKIKLQKNDVVYLFSDGYADQIDKTGKEKFGKKRLRELLLKIHKNSAKDQLDLLENEFNLWRGNVKQLDDVCVIGVRI